MNGNGDFSELIEYLDGKFQQTATKQDISDVKDEIFGLATKAELYSVRDELDKKIDDKFNQIMDVLDGIAKLLETHYQELLALCAKVDRHEEWIKSLAEKAGVKLEY